jgi:threonylcarbamoyladenosine tRNA methylthiotransferase MtaB
LVAHLIAPESADGDLLGTIAAASEICRLPVRRFGDRSRAYLRIQDGCESFCTYCIVPFTRGPSRSLPEAEVLEQARIYAGEGYREIILTGIHLGNYGRDLVGRPALTPLLDRLSMTTPGVAYRISSLEPLEIDEALLALMADRRNIRPHLHIPLQSGHEEILARMNRRYTTGQFREIIELCRARLPDAAIGIDILAGFPGETDAHFAACLAFLQGLPFTYLHVFPYSKRPGTVAAGFADQVPEPVKEARVATLRQLSEEKRADFYRSQLGRTWPVIVEGRRDDEGLLQGFTANYLAVRFAGPDSLRNGETRVKLLNLKDNHILGERIAHES